MPRALWLLMRFRLKGWARRMVRNLQTPRAAIATILFGLVMLFWFGGMCINVMVASRAKGATAAPEQVERFVPLVMLLYCLGALGFGAGHAVLNFTPAEVQFLFAGPFSRRQILTYKLLSQFLLMIPVCLITTFAARQIAGSLISGFAGAFLILTFMQLFVIAQGMVANTLGEWTHTRARRILLVIVGLAIAGAIFAGWRASGGGTEDTKTVLLNIEQSDIVQYGLLPLRWFARTLASPELDGRFLLNLMLATSVNLGMVVLVFVLDAQYIEAAATATEKRYEMIQRMRSGGVASMSLKPATRVRYRTPDPQWLGGIGPILWRQIIAAIRSRRIFSVLLFATAISCVGPVIGALSDKGGKFTEGLPWLLASMGLFMSMMLSQILAFDFRSDVDRIEVLKTLPIPAWRIVVGQILTPVILTSVYQILLTVLVYIILGKIGVLVVAVTVLSWPVNLLLTGMDNLMFLLFPTRMAAANPGDFSHAGRQMLMLMGKGIGLAIGIGIPATFGAMAYSLTQSWFAAIPATLAPALVICLLPIPLITMAFQRFDVARDTPP